MSGLSRSKGARAERELIRLISERMPELDLSRNLTQYQRSGEADVLGLDPFAIECKRYKHARDGDIASWWRETVTQAEAVQRVPLLAYRADRQRWRFVMQLSYAVDEQTSYVDHSVDLTVTLYEEGFFDLLSALRQRENEHAVLD